MVPFPHRMFNKDEFACLVRQARLAELACKRRVDLIRVGLSAVIPLECLQLLTPDDLALRMCGVPYINVNFLKVGKETRRGEGASQLSLACRVNFLLVPTS